MLEFLKSQLFNIISIGFAIVSLVFALYESRRNKKLQGNIRVNCWMFYQRTSNLGGTIQKCLNVAQEHEIDKTFYSNIVRSDALCAELMKENIRLIYTFEPSFTKDDIDRWDAEGKLGGGYKDIFKQFTIN